MSPERELMLRVVSVRPRREAERDVIRALVDRVDFNLLHHYLFHQKLLPLVGLRLEEIAADKVPEGFRRVVDEDINHLRKRSWVLAQLTRQAAEAVEAEGANVLSLKGPALSERLYGDAGLRPCTDIDLLVAPEDFDRAVSALVRLGYARPSSAHWFGSLPLFESSLEPKRPWLVALDLHWRVHWYETGFSRGLLERSAVDGRGMRVMRPADELALLLATFARDGFHGLRHAADVAAWWDAHSESLAEPPLDDVVADHPELRDALATAAAVVSALVGVPAEGLISFGPTRTRASSIASRLANWSQALDEKQSAAVMGLVDGLLSPRKERWTFVCRHALPPPKVIGHVYGLPEDAALRRRLLRLRYGVVIASRFLPRWAGALWRVRGGRELVPRPAG